MTTKPVFVFAAIPTPSTTFADLFSEGSVKGLLEKPGGLRQNGWDLQTLDSARIVEGEYLQVRDGDRKIINLYEHGTLLVRADATDDLLAWGSSQTHPDTLRLNPLALLEFTYSFVALYTKLIEYMASKPSVVTLRVQLENALGAQVLYMFPYGVGATNWLHPMRQDRHPAPSERFQRVLIVGTEVLIHAPAEIAYQIVERIYTWFGLTIEQIPYVKTDNGARVIDVHLIASGGKNISYS